MKKGLRILLITSWDNAWIPHFRLAFEKRGHQVVVIKKEDVAHWQLADVVLHMWACVTNPVRGAVNIMFMRRYEFFDYNWHEYDWSKIDKLIFCNDFFKSEFDKQFNKPPCETELIYNVVDTGKWTFRQRVHGNKIGMACHVHPKKNLPLAVEILKELGGNYELHIAGQIQDACTALYLTREKNVFLYGHVPKENMNEWWGDKNYCLSTSISEGNPNNVIEAMAKGIPAVINNWPGAKSQFPAECVFDKVSAAVDFIKRRESENYRSRITSDFLRQWVMDKYSIRNIETIVGLAEQLFDAKAKKSEV